MAVHELTQEQARRVAVRAQLLDAPRPVELLDVVRRLAVVQLDATRAVAPSHHLVLWSRLGTAYAPRDLEDAVAAQRLVDLQGYLRPAEDLALHRDEMARWPGPDPEEWRLGTARWLEVNEPFRQDVLQRLREDGPLAAREIPDTAVRPWRSSGWNHGRSVRMLLEILEARGEVAVVDRLGGRLWDLAARVHPHGPAVPAREARRRRAERRLRALGLARARSVQVPGEANDVGEAGEAAVVDGVRGTWRVDPDQVARLGEPFEGRVVLLSPLDRLVFDRRRMTELFAFDYQLEMYKPAAKRRWGYWALPVLVGDRLLGKVDATADDRAGVLRVDAVHEDEEWDAATRAAVTAELEDLAEWLEVDLLLPR